jgi:hypothetical protein
MSVIGAELLVPVLAMFRRTQRLSMLLSSTLGLLFITALIMLRRTGTAIECHCFGILVNHLPIAFEFLFDLILVNVSACCAFLLHRLATLGGNVKRTGTRSLLVRWAIVLCLEVAIAFPLLSPPGLPTPAVSLDGLDSFLPPHGDPRDAINQRSVVFLLNLQDFSCPICFDDFLALVDSLNQRDTTGSRIRSFAVFSREGSEPLLDRGQMETWLIETGIRCRYSIVPDSLLRSTGFRKSMMVVVDHNGTINKVAEFPMGERNRRSTLALLTVE